jgi:hypothetical protein
MCIILPLAYKFVIVFIKSFDPLKCLLSSLCLNSMFLIPLVAFFFFKLYEILLFAFVPSVSPTVTGFDINAISFNHLVLLIYFVFLLSGIRAASNPVHKERCWHS